jgi:hypothetical protein
LRAEPSGAAGVCNAVQAVPADVCGHRNFYGQCAAEKGENVGSVAGEADKSDLQVGTDAGAAISGLGASVNRFVAPKGFGRWLATCIYDFCCVTKVVDTLP